jgi:hypothetical protein
VPAVTKISLFQGDTCSLIQMFIHRINNSKITNGWYYSGDKIMDMETAAEEAGLPRNGGGIFFFLWNPPFICTRHHPPHDGLFLDDPSWYVVEETR